MYVHIEDICEQQTIVFVCVCVSDEIGCVFLTVDNTFWQVLQQFSNFGEQFASQEADYRHHFLVCSVSPLHSIYIYIYNICQ